MVGVGAAGVGRRTGVEGREFDRTPAALNPAFTAVEGDLGRTGGVQGLELCDGLGLTGVDDRDIAGWEGEVEIALDLPGVEGLEVTEAVLVLRAEVRLLPLLE